MFPMKKIFLALLIHLFINQLDDTVSFGSH